MAEDEGKPFTEEALRRETTKLQAKEAKLAEADGGSGSRSGSGGSPTKAAEEAEAEVLASVVAMGFGVEAAKAALDACGGDAEGAVERLLAQKDEEG